MSGEQATVTVEALALVRRSDGSGGYWIFERRTANPLGYVYREGSYGWTLERRLPGHRVEYEPMCGGFALRRDAVAYFAEQLTLAVAS